MTHQVDFKNYNENRNQYYCNLGKCEIKQTIFQLEEGKSFFKTFWLENKEDTLKQKWVVFYADASIRSIHMISKQINEITYSKVPNKLGVRITVLVGTNLEI